MTELDRKVIEYFPGKIVRKDLTTLMKKGANVPTYVLEYLLGMYCATDDEDAIEMGLEKIRKITGLDLREFDHAIVFKVALMVKKYLSSKPGKF